MASQHGREHPGDDRTLSDKTDAELLEILGEAASEASSQPPAEGKESLGDYLERLADAELDQDPGSVD